MRFKWIFDRQGFTLVEILVSFAVLSVAVLALLGYYGTALSGSQASTEIITATFLAQEKLEALEGMPFDSITSESEEAVPGYPLYRREVTVHTETYSLKRVTVTVKWSEKGQTQEVRLDSLFLR